MPAPQAGVASAIAGTARQVGAVLGVALLGSLSITRFHALLPGRLASLRLSPHASATINRATNNALTLPAATHGPGQVRVLDAVHAAFTSATHLGYLVGAAAGLLIVAVAAGTMRRRPRAQPARHAAPQDPSLLAPHAAEDRRNGAGSEVARVDQPPRDRVIDEQV